MRPHSRAAVIVVILVFPGMAPATPPGAPNAAVSHNSGNQQKEKDKKDAESIAPQDSDYRKAAPSQYVGSDTCKGCHEEMGKSFDRGPHWKTTMAKHQGPQWQGCEACHGPGKEHAESADPSKIIRFPNLSREEASRRCLGCHQSSQEHANFLRSQHMKNNVGCVDCHSIHHPAVEEKLLKVAQPTLCFTCHAEVKLDSSKPFHKSANDKAANCTNCHNPHGVAEPQPKPKITQRH